MESARDSSPDPRRPPHSAYPRPHLVRPSRHPSILQRVAEAAATPTGRPEPETCHTLRHSGVNPASCGATHLLENGHDLRILQEMGGDTAGSTATASSHVLNRGPAALRSTADRLGILHTPAPSSAGSRPAEICCQDPRHSTAGCDPAPVRPAPLPTRGYPQNSWPGVPR
jgi:hypothetical protein